MLYTIFASALGLDLSFLAHNLTPISVVLDWGSLLKFVHYCFYSYKHISCSDLTSNDDNCILAMGTIAFLFRLLLTLASTNLP